GAVEGVMKPGITSTNSSEARRGECTPRAVSSARLSRLRGFGDQSGGAMVRSYAAARIHISSPARDVDDRLWGGTDGGGAPYTQAPPRPRTPRPGGYVHSRTASGCPAHKTTVGAGALSVPAQARSASFSKRSRRSR